MCNIKNNKEPYRIPSHLASSLNLWRVIGVWGPLRPSAMPECDKKGKISVNIFDIEKETVTYHIPRLC